MGRRLSSAICIFVLTQMILSCFAAEEPYYYTLVVLWPGAYCEQTNGGCCLPTTGEPDAGFLIRDLIPYDSNGYPITRCKNANFDYNLISGLSDALQAHWVNIKCPSNNGRSNWRAKWRNYGACSGLNETEYFRAGLNLFQKVDVAFNLVTKAILPDYNLYKIDDIKGAIAEGVGAEPLLRCSNGPFKKYQLFEVHICIDSSGTSAIDCPFKPKFTCSEEVLFHPYRSWMLNDTSKAFQTDSDIQLPFALE